MNENVISNTIDGFLFKELSSHRNIIDILLYIHEETLVHPFAIFLIRITYLEISLRPVRLDGHRYKNFN